jgi:hypothetical protein
METTAGGGFRLRRGNKTIREVFSQGGREYTLPICPQEKAIVPCVMERG